jgi:hypothetical protein
MYRGVRAAGEAVNEVIRRPGSGELQLTLPHHGAGGLEFVLIAFDALTVDQVGNIQKHLSTFCHSAADFLV